RRAPLDNGGLAAVCVQVLRDVVAAGAGADDERFLAAPVGAVVELGRMQHVALEVLEPGQLRNVRISYEPVGEHEMLRVHGALRAVTMTHHGFPSPGGFIVRSAYELGAGPEIDFHRPRI